MLMHLGKPWQCSRHMHLINMYRQHVIFYLDIRDVIFQEMRKEELSNEKCIAMKKKYTHNMRYICLFIHNYNIRMHSWIVIAVVNCTLRTIITQKKRENHFCLAIRSVNLTLLALANVTHTPKRLDTSQLPAARERHIISPNNFPFQFSRAIDDYAHYLVPRASSFHLRKAEACLEARIHVLLLLAPTTRRLSATAANLHK